MKKFFTKIKGWFVKHKPSKRRLIQLYAALLYNANLKGFIKGDIYTGNSKYMCVPGLNCYSCPGAVGACPLGALQNALASSGTRAPYYVFGIILLFGLILGRTICGFLCPVGLVQELFYKIKTPKLKKSRFTRIFSYFKYVILIGLVVAIPLMYSLNAFPVPGFCKYICPAGTLGGAIGLLIHPKNAAYFNMLGPLFTWKFCVMVVIYVASIFIFRFFCRFFCPLGAIYGFFNKIALIGVKLDKNKCTDCGLCVAHCKMDIRHVGDHECINCGECIDVCPAKAISWKGSKLFLHKNAVETVNEPAEEVKPLAVAAGGVTVQNMPQESAVQVAPAALYESALEPVESKQPEAASDSAPEAAPEVAKKPKKVRGRGFFLQVVAWVAALAVLLTALIYFNFIAADQEKVEVGNEVGDACPEFTLSYIGKEGEFHLTSGKVTVINFWATWCTPCVGEIPFFEQLYQNYSQSVEVVAVHGTFVTENVEAFLVTKGWTSYGISFAQDAATETADSVYTLLGGSTTWPMTVVLDQSGVIVYNQAGSVTYADLESIVKPLLEK